MGYRLMGWYTAYEGHLIKLAPLICGSYEYNFALQFMSVRQLRAEQAFQILARVPADIFFFPGNRYINDAGFYLHIHLRRLLLLSDGDVDLQYN